MCHNDSRSVGSVQSRSFFAPFALLSRSSLLLSVFLYEFISDKAVCGNVRGVAGMDIRRGVNPPYIACRVGFSTGFKPVDFNVLYNQQAEIQNRLLLV